jgi:GWxTD domain-containing protein
MSYKSLLNFLLLLLSATLPLWAQAEMSNSKDTKGPWFHIDTVNLATPEHREKSRLSLFIELVYDELQFVKMVDDYEASYEVSITIFDKDGDQTDGKTFREMISVNNFDQTNKRTMYNLSNQVFDMDPGSYKISVAVQDQETNQSSHTQKNIELRDFSKDKLALSDIIWVNELEPDSSGEIRSIRPQISDLTKGLGAPAFAYFEVYNPGNADNITVDYELFQEQIKKSVKKSLSRNFTKQKTMAYFPIQVDSLNHGLYHLTVSAAAGKEKVKVSKDFYIRWSSLPTNARDLKEAIEQTRYIADKDEWKKLKNAKGDQLLVEFKKFWLRRDPTPGTEINEAMDAHYTRIEYANQNFSAMQHQGWRTDMGMVYIILGPPDDVERNAYPRYSKPYEIWYYYRYNRDFVFLDLTGFGDFRLDTPFSIYEFQRLIDNP